MIDVIDRDNKAGNPTDHDTEKKESEISEGIMTTEQFLGLVGSRVRENRMAIGMSRKLLAKKSGVSERYLAQLESGQGNISIKLLRKVSLAIGVSLEKLMAEKSQSEVVEEEA